MRVATIDIGTNTVLLLVAEVADSGGLEAVEERATITRLGEGVDRTRHLSPVAIERTSSCLGNYAHRIRELAVDRVAVVGTSAMRDAGGGDEIRAQVRSLLGVDARVLSGGEEARLTFRGALSGLPHDQREDVAVFDVGGGSTEIVIGRSEPLDQIHFAESFDVGSVRLTERYIEHDPPTLAERQQVAAAAKDAFARVPPLPAHLHPVGIAGTVTTLAAVSLGLAPYDGKRVHGHVMARDEVAQVVDRLAGLPLVVRAGVAGMEPKRADVILAGGAIVLSLLDRWSATAVRVSDRGVRWGLAEEIAGESGSA